MARTRLRDARTAEQERELYSRTYPGGYKHTVWPDHVERIAASVAFLNRWSSRFKTVADLSCGDGAIMRGIAHGLTEVYLGDLNGVSIGTQEAVATALTGARKVSAIGERPLPDALWALPEGALPVDLYVCSETLEHMDDPDRLLQSITLFSKYLFISTPVDERHDSGNLEHYWSWSTEDMGEMLRDAGWTPLEKQVLVPESTRHLDGAYTYQLWMAVAR